MTRPNMDENDLARFLDARELSEEERGGAVAHLSESDLDAELLADAAYMLRELEAAEGVIPIGRPEPRHHHGNDEDKGAEPRPAPSRPPSTRPGYRRGAARWLALAAVLAGVLLVPLALFRSRGGDAASADFAVLLANQNAGLPANWTATRPWGRVRGSGDPLTGSDNGRSARLGVLWVDLEVAVAAGQAAQTDSLCMDIKNLLADVLATAAAASRCDDIVQNAGSPAAQKALLKKGRLGVVEYAPDPAHFALGAWGEAAKLAADRRDVAFFSAKRSRRALDGFAESRDLAPAARDAAVRVRARLRNGDAPATLKTDIDALVRAAHQPDDLELLP